MFIKKLLKPFALITCISCVISFSACTVTPVQVSPMPPVEEEDIKIVTADDLAKYIKDYININGIQEDTAENHYLLDKNFKLSVKYNKLYWLAIPEYPQDVLADALPLSVTCIGKDGSAYFESVGTYYFAQNLPVDFYGRNVDVEKIYYDADTLTGYSDVSIETQKFDVYPEFEGSEQEFVYKGKWIFGSKEEFESCSKSMLGNYVTSYLVIQAINHLFKADITDLIENIPAIRTADFEKLVIEQKGDIVSFESSYNDDNCTSYAKGTLDLKNINFNYSYKETQYENGHAILQSEYIFDLSGLDENYVIDFDLDGDFELSQDYLRG